MPDCCLVMSFSNSALHGLFSSFIDSMFRHLIEKRYSSFMRLLSNFKKAILHQAKQAIFHPFRIVTRAGSKFLHELADKSELGSKKRKVHVNTELPLAG